MAEKFREMGSELYVGSNDALTSESLSGEPEPAIDNDDPSSAKE